MPIKTIAFLCRGCGAIFRKVDECQQHESKCPQLAKEKQRLHDLTSKLHAVEAKREPHPTKTIQTRKTAKS